jgi:hypothetical protein
MTRLHCAPIWEPTPDVAKRRVLSWDPSQSREQAKGVERATSVIDDTLVVVAVAHVKRKPGYWVERVQ